MDELRINRAEYLASYPTYKICPKSVLPEYAFIGRSNVGKSSLINMLTGRKDLARTSKQPGKTQLINLYLIDDTWQLADLPGYGYAKVAKKTRSKWELMVTEYLRYRPNMACAFQLVDINVPPQSSDQDFMAWMAKNRIPFAIAYTKSDRLTKNKLASNIAAYRKHMLASWTAIPTEFVTSGETNAGRDEMLGFINSINLQFKVQ